MGETRQRMEVISAKMKEYYRHQGELPVPAGETLPASPFPVTLLEGGVPVDELNLEAKFAMDGFGQRFVYRVQTRNGSTNRDISAFTVDGIQYIAGVLISGGGNQNISTGATGTIVNNTTYNTTGDDVVVPVNVNREAMEIALDEVRELQRRVNQFDNLFEGTNICNFANNPALNSGCQPAKGGDWDLDSTNCGTGSLDQIQDEGPATTANNYGCDTGWYTSIGRNADFSSTNNAALQFIVGFYALGNNYLLDPWGNPYQWGCGPVCTVTDSFCTADPRYRKFFSTGPDGDIDDDPSAAGYCTGTPPVTIVDDIIP